MNTFILLTALFLQGNIGDQLHLQQIPVQTEKLRHGYPTDTQMSKEQFVEWMAAHIQACMNEKKSSEITINFSTDWISIYCTSLLKQFTTCPNKEGTK